ncbi:hypothetical protein EDD18DRAFT_1078253 [Armillaria luteobubalina]|uniref:Reverse transcriptase zinc-binding domain-containing protein n=1 Tax=Armillaria luteobubalina TaxID=153913 RepID=A0AA39PZN5_9AGAR|nr:hypothetical protein EDD18DRAFT_1078253 [Armillaria luteobubalina]
MNVSQLVATKELATKANKRMSLYHEISSKYVIHQLTSSLKKNEDAGYIGIPNRELIQAMIANLRNRKQTTTMQWIKTTDGHQRNTTAKTLANDSARKNQDDHIDLDIDPKLQITGAALSKLTQKRAYQALREQKTQSLLWHAKTTSNINLAIEGAKASFGTKTNEQALWKSLRHRDIDRSTRYFLWMAMHDAYRIGGKWLHFDPQYHERAYCTHCNNSLESMDHILMRCSSLGQKEIWGLTRKLLELRDIPWHQPEMSNILACAAPVFKSQSGHRESRKERFF